MTVDTLASVAATASLITSLFPQVDERPEGEEGDEVILNIKPMQPLVRASQYGYMRGLGMHQARTVPPSLHVSRLSKSPRRRRKMLAAWGSTLSKAVLVVAGYSETKIPGKLEMVTKCSLTVHPTILSHVQGSPVEVNIL